jgi:HSP20 family protein
MSLIKYSGGVPTDIFSWMDKLHDEFWKSPEIQFNRNWRPTDIVEDDKQYKIEVELPRFKREDVKVEVTKGILKINAKNAKSTYIRQFQLPYVDYDKAEVKLEDGVLNIIIPKTAESQTKYLDIK